MPSFTATIITVSTGIAAGNRADSSGQILREGLAKLGLAVTDGGVIPDDILGIQRQTVQRCDFEATSLLVFTGGTGPTPDDVTPQALSPLLDRRFNGVENALHDDGRAANAKSPLSRLVVGARGKTIVIALPGSPGAVKDALKTLEPLLSHLLALTAGLRDPH